MEPQIGDAPACVHGSCPGHYVDDMFMDRVPCGCGCHRGRIATALLGLLHAGLGTDRRAEDRPRERSRR